jgi:hypothetical protein
MKSALFAKVTDPSYEITRYISQGHGGDMKRQRFACLIELKSVSYRNASELIDRVAGIGPVVREEGVGCRVEVRCGRIGKQVVEGIDNGGRLLGHQTEDDGGGGESRLGRRIGTRCEGPRLWPRASLEDWRRKSAGGKSQGNEA